jgi:hypothetical protein
MKILLKSGTFEGFFPERPKAILYSRLASAKNFYLRFRSALEMNASAAGKSGLGNAAKKLVQ